jgi:nuclear pore complex protein Nup205
LGAYITAFGAPHGQSNLRESRDLNKLICSSTDDDAWILVYLRSTVRAWWIAEYSSWYADDASASALDGVNLDEEDQLRSNQFAECLKDGAFDFILSVAADSKSTEWPDPARAGVRQWLQRLSPPLMTDSIPFSDFFQTSMMTQLEIFVDACISNLPDVLRKLRTDEDEQRQLSQTHEHGLDLERFLLIIAYAYDGRPEPAESFWREPDSNLSGFLHWTSRRASTPLVSAFCEMLQAISSSEAWATAAHLFLKDETHHAQGKMRRTLSLTWKQIFKELAFFTNKVQERPVATQGQIYRGGKPSSEQAETEPESAMMLESYLRLITKLATQSEEARLFLLKDPGFTLVDVIFQLGSPLFPARLRACAFLALNALMARKTQEEGYIMWQCVDAWLTGSFANLGVPARAPGSSASQSPLSRMEATLAELADGFEQSYALTQLLVTLVSPASGYESLSDTLAFGEDLGSSVRMPGIDEYVDFVLGRVLAIKSAEVQDQAPARMLRFACLEFAEICLSTFNEDLIVISNESNVGVDRAIGTTDLATYVKLHPFARVMEWMFNDKAMNALFATIHADNRDISNASPTSPLIQSILKAVEVTIKVLQVQDTYLDVVRPLIKLQPGHRRQTVANAAYASFEDGIMNHLDLVVDLGRYCAIGYAPLTLACLRLLELISASPKLSAAWNAEPGRDGSRSKAVVALEANGEAEIISASLVAELTATLDFVQQADAPDYLIKKGILEFLKSSLQATPDQPTPAHLLLGFHCGTNRLSIAPNSAFEASNSLFHNIIRVLLELPFGDDALGMRGWLINLKSSALQILQTLWSSPLSRSLVMEELRSHDFLFALLMREVVIQPGQLWDGLVANTTEFLASGASLAYIDFLDLRAMLLDYAASELCSVSQGRVPALKRRIFEAFGGKVESGDGEAIAVPNVFDLFDFLPPDSQLEVQPPEVNYYRDVDLRCCLTEDAESGPLYDVNKVQEILQLKRNEERSAKQLIPENELSAAEKEEVDLLEYLVCVNRQNQIAAYRLRVLRTWTSLITVMVASIELQGSAKTSFLLQALQTLLPSLETFGASQPAVALELAKLTKILLFELDLDVQAPSLGPQGTQAMTTQRPDHLLGEKLFQLFQICLGAVGKVPRNPELRSLYYSICSRYLTIIGPDKLLEHSLPSMLISEAQGNSRRRAVKSLAVYGDRLLTVCDDALSSETECQTSALILLGGLVYFSSNGDPERDDAHIVETLNGLNFISILVDSLTTMLADWLAIVQAGDKAQQQCYEARLALLQALSQTRDGAKHLLAGNVFRAIDLSGLFRADPELEVNPADSEALALHYALLVKVTRIIGAAIVSRGSTNVLQGRKFLIQHRMLITHTLKRSAGIGASAGGGLQGGRAQDGHRSVVIGKELDERIEELAEAFMVLITATGFLEVSILPANALCAYSRTKYLTNGMLQFEEQGQAEVEKRRVPGLFH